MRTINVEPDWSGLFRYSTQLVKDQLPENKGQAFIVEMLEFGGRLYEESQRIEITEEKECVDEVHCLNCDGVYFEQDTMVETCPTCGNRDKMRTVYLQKGEE